jgi:hypothetical protein
VFRLVLDGHSPSEVVTLLAGEYDLGAQDGDVAEGIVALCDALRSSLLFRPLFQAAPTVEQAA